MTTIEDRIAGKQRVIDMLNERRRNFVAAQRAGHGMNLDELKQIDIDTRRAREEKAQLEHQLAERGRSEGKSTRSIDIPFAKEIAAVRARAQREIESIRARIWKDKAAEDAAYRKVLTWQTEQINAYRNMSDGRQAALLKPRPAKITIRYGRVCKA